MSGATERKAISKARRFELFKRDGFTCQYCGRRPPAIVLEIDHITPVVAGGSNDDHNLISSCFDCNRGKGASSLDATPLDVQQKATLLRERLEQAKAYDALLREEREGQEAAINEVVAAYERAFPGWTLPEGTRTSIRSFLQKLPRTAVVDAMEKACSRVHRDAAFRYFCGVCWRTIKED